MTTQWDYESITASALQTITDIANDARRADGAQAEPRWAMAYGVMRGWCELVGQAARAEDRAMMEQLFEGMPLGRDDTGEQAGWHFSSVLVLPVPDQRQGSAQGFGPAV